MMVLSRCSSRFKAANKKYFATIRAIWINLVLRALISQSFSRMVPCMHVFTVRIANIFTDILVCLTNRHCKFARAVFTNTMKRNKKHCLKSQVLHDKLCLLGLIIIYYFIWTFSFYVNLIL